MDWIDVQPLPFKSPASLWSNGRFNPIRRSASRWRRSSGAKTRLTNLTDRHTHYYILIDAFSRNKIRSKFSNPLERQICTFHFDLY